MFKFQLPENKHQYAVIFSQKKHLKEKAQLAYVW